MYIPKIIYNISKDLTLQGAKAIVVGGSVRDHFLHLPTKDYDIEVYGLQNMDLLIEILQCYGSVNLVGKSFGVLKFSYDGDAYDFSIPRSEKKIAEGHRGFDVTLDGSMHFKSAAKRRDFTVNAMGYDISQGQFLDPYNAMDDIQHKILRHIDDTTFVDDPLRIYRAIQFSARFGYRLATPTLNLCKEMVASGMLEHLATERIYGEIKKLLLKSPKPSIGFELMRELGILPYFPELEALIDVPQSPKWHPEGDVWTHTLMSVDAMVSLLGSDEKLHLKYMFAILCHDFGKALCTTIDTDQTIQSHGHEYKGIEPTKTFMQRLTNEKSFIESLLPLVEHHLKPSQLYASQSKDSAIRRLATKVNIEELVIVAKADFLGRATKEAKRGYYPAGDWLLERSKKMKVENKPLENLLQGRDLIDMGFTPSPQFKEILDALYILQLDGILNTKEQALTYVKQTYNDKTTSTTA